MIRVYIAKYRAKDCYDSCMDLYTLLKEYDIEAKYISYRNTIEIEGQIQITFIPDTQHHLAGLRCDCIVGVSDYEKYLIEYGSKYNQLFKNIKTEARLINELVCAFSKRRKELCQE